MPKQPLQQTLLRFIQAVGVWTSTGLALAFLILAVTYIRAGSVIDKDALALVKRSDRQLVLVERISKKALQIEVALHTDDWDIFEPALAELSQDHTLWSETHDSLRSSRQNGFGVGGGNRSIKAYFDRLDFPQSQISQALDEIEIVTQSIVRRAPYIDQSSRDRILAAVDSLQANEPEFEALMSEIVKLYELNASTGSSNAISGVRSSLMFLLGAIVLTLIVGVAPRYRAFITQNSKLSTDLEHAQASANKRWRLLASLGHEFRTPMSTIMGFAGLLANEEQDEATKKEFAGSITDSGAGLMSLIQDIIDMAAIEADELAVHPATTDPHKVFSDLESEFAELAEDSGLEFRLFFDDSCPASVTTDEERLKQIIRKVVQNAIEFTDAGSVELHASLETIDNTDMFVVRVVDTGLGIKPKDTARIFEPFERIETGMTRDHQGAGLGLTIARALTRRLGGDLTLESAMGAGSFVTIAVDPGQYITQSSSKQNNPEPIAPEVVADHEIMDSKYVLIIEDGKDNQRLLSHHLTKAGCRIQLAENGQVGIDRYKASIEAGRPFDLILMDMQMPVMDGYQATTLLRKDGVTIPILGVSAHSAENDRQRCLDSGCDEYLIKPVNKQTLLDCCSRWLDQHNETSEPESPQQKAA